MTQGDPCPRPIYKEENNFLKHKRCLSCSQSPGMEQAQCSARFLAWKWRPPHGPAGPSSLRLSLPIHNTRSGDVLAHASGGPWFWECGSLVCSREESYEWVMAKDFFWLYPSLNLFLDICPFGYGFYWDLWVSHVLKTRGEKGADWMFHLILFPKEKLLFSHLLRKKKSRFNH